MGANDCLGASEKASVISRSPASFSNHARHFLASKMDTRTTSPVFVVLYFGLGLHDGFVFLFVQHLHRHGVLLVVLLRRLVGSSMRGRFVFLPSPPQRRATFRSQQLLSLSSNDRGGGTFRCHKPKKKFLVHLVLPAATRNHFPKKTVPRSSWKTDLLRGVRGLIYFWSHKCISNRSCSATLRDTYLAPGAYTTSHASLSAKPSLCSLGQSTHLYLL